MNTRVLDKFSAEESLLFGITAKQLRRKKYNLKKSQHRTDDMLESLLSKLRSRSFYLV